MASLGQIDCGAGNGIGAMDWHFVLSDDDDDDDDGEVCAASLPSSGSGSNDTSIAAHNAFGNAEHRIKRECPNVCGSESGDATQSSKNDFDDDHDDKRALSPRPLAIGDGPACAQRGNSAEGIEMSGDCRSRCQVEATEVPGLASSLAKDDLGDVRNDSHYDKQLMVTSAAAHGSLCRNHRSWTWDPPAQPGCEVYVGGVPPGTSNITVQRAFEDLFSRLPDFISRYSSIASPIVRVHVPGAHRVATYRFVQFRDEVLAITALSMSGLRIANISCRVSSADTQREVSTAQKRGLDVTSLRKTMHLPFNWRPAGVMLCCVWVACASDDLHGPWQRLAAEVSDALLRLPAVRHEFPELLMPVPGLRIVSSGTYAFLEMANEVLASTLVAMGRIVLPNGCQLKTGWPAHYPDAKEHAPPSLDTSRAWEGSAARSESRDASPSLAESSSLDQSCDVCIGGAAAAGPPDIWAALERALRTLPAYRAKYSDAVDPVVSLRVGPGPFAFATMADQIVASMLIRLGSVWVSGRRLQLLRPHHSSAPSSSLLAAPRLTSSAQSSVNPDPREHKGKPSQPQLPVRVRLSQPQPQYWSAPCPEPPAPLSPSAVVHISNLAPLGSHDEAERLLDMYLTRLALNSSACEVEAGPPVKRVRLHHDRRSALVELWDDGLLDDLLLVFDGSPYLGLHLMADRPVVFSPHKGEEDQQRDGAGARKPLVRKRSS